MCQFTWFTRKQLTSGSLSWASLLLRSTGLVRNWSVSRTISHRDSGMVLKKLADLFKSSIFSDILTFYFTSGLFLPLGLYFSLPVDFYLYLWTFFFTSWIFFSFASGLFSLYLWTFFLPLGSFFSLPLDY